MSNVDKIVIVIFSFILSISIAFGLTLVPHILAVNGHPAVGNTVWFAVAWVGFLVFVSVLWFKTMIKCWKQKHASV